MQLNTLVDYLNEVLLNQAITDYCPNGLQVQGKSEVRVLVTGVTACLALLEAALQHQADAILVHHGYFWRDEAPCIVGAKQVRLQLLLQHDINLLAYHLPLDIHPRWGNNVQLAQRLGIIDPQPLSTQARSYVFQGTLATPLTGAAFAEHITHTLGRQPLHIPGSAPVIRRLTWCTGAGQSLLHEAISAGADAYLTGEVSEQTVHQAREAGIHFFAAGHHATERYGVQALGQHLAQQFGLEHHFIDSDNPV